MVVSANFTAELSPCPGCHVMVEDFGVMTNKVINYFKEPEDPLLMKNEKSH